MLVRKHFKSFADGVELGKEHAHLVRVLQGVVLEGVFLEAVKKNELARLKGQLLSYYLRDVHLEFIRTPFQF